LTAERSLQDWLEYIRTVHFRSIDMSLDRVQSVRERMVDSADFMVDSADFKVLAVAGTNGKGSCAGMLGAVLSEAGHRTGVYTSPHLARFNERIRIDGKGAGDDELCRAFELIESARADVPLTYFEFATLAAVDIFRRRGAAFAVMEVGMGGRLDAVNALPIDAALITNVELDHVHWLGPDRESIGREKAPVMRGGRPAVFNHPDIPRTVLNYAERIGAPLLIRGRDYQAEERGTGWRWHGPQGEVWDMDRPPIPGVVQVDNAAGVLALLSRLEELDLDRDTAARGLANTRVPGRCEIVARAPLVMIDVAHNLSAVEVLAQQLASNPVPGTTTAVFGMLRDKDPAGVVERLGGLVDVWRVAGIEDERGQSADELIDTIDASLRAPVHRHTNVIEAYEAALGQAGANDRIVVFGSFLIAGDILAHMKRTC